MLLATRRDANRFVVRRQPQRNKLADSDIAIITGGKGKAEDKIRSLQESGVVVASSPTKIGEAMLEALQKSGRAAAKPTAMKSRK